MRKERNFNRFLVGIIIGMILWLLVQAWSAHSAEETIPFRVIDIDHGAVILQPYVAPIIGTKVVTGAAPDANAVLDCKQETVVRGPDRFYQLDCGAVRLELNEIHFGD